ncbi:hypothetical protein T492DRAFT_887892, partial [Pavlovales sp. CCMP2436]
VERAVAIDLAAAAAAAASEAAAYAHQPLKLAIGTSFDRPPPFAPLGEPQLVQLTFEQLDSVLHVAGIPQVEIDTVISRKPPPPSVTTVSSAAEVGTKRPLGESGADPSTEAVEAEAKRARLAGDAVKPEAAEQQAQRVAQYDVNVQNLMKLTGGTFGHAIFAALRPYVPKRPPYVPPPPPAPVEEVVEVKEEDKFVVMADGRLVKSLFTRGPTHPVLQTIGNGGSLLLGAQRYY